jgi:hypothetical protein
MTRRELKPSLAAMEQSAIVEARGLTKRYGGAVLAVDSVDMSVVDKLELRDRVQAVILA